MVKTLTNILRQVWDRLGVATRWVLPKKPRIRGASPGGREVGLASPPLKKGDGQS